MTVALITPPAIEPVGLAEAKAHLRVDHGHEDQLILDILKVARQHVEFSCGQKLISQTWRQYESSLASNRRLTLKVNPIEQVASVIVFDADGEPSTLASDQVELCRGIQPPQIQFADDFHASRAANGLEIDVLAGFGSGAETVPGTLKRAILLLTAHWYEFRGAISPQQQPVSLPPGYEALIAAHRRVHL